MWRDEVRAFSLALDGDTVAAMLRGVHGEGHPALWYLLLRGAHALWPVPQSMQVLAFLIAATAALLFALRAPFGWAILLFALLGRFALYEYGVMARNYGISMLILFVLAAVYPRWRDSGWLPGFLLLLLCNTNVHSVPLAAAFLLFWACDVAGDVRPGWSRPWRALALGALLALSGALLCVAEVYPPFNDGAQIALPQDAAEIAGLIPRHGLQLGLLVVPTIRTATQALLIPLILVAILAGWWRRPGALLAGGAGAAGLILLFAFVYQGAYRHQALIVPFLLTIAWLVEEGHGGRWRGQAAVPPAGPRLRGAGLGALALLLLMQDAQSVAFVTRALRGMPESRAAEMGVRLRRPDLARAIVIGDTDFRLEALPYYAPNPIYFVRERRFGVVSHFTNAARRTMTPADILAAACRLHAATGRPIAIVMSEAAFRNNLPGVTERGYFGDFIASADDLALLRRATRPLVSYEHITAGDEYYDLLLYPPRAGRTEHCPAR